MSQTNYYDTGNIDLKYMEIGIALQQIDRMNPGSVPFCIPSLTPNENKTTVTEKKIIQKSKVNIVTDNAAAVDVSNIELSNAIYITIPKELVALPGARYDIEGTIIGFEGHSGNVFISGDLRGLGTVIPSGVTPGSIDVNGSVSGTPTTYEFTNGSINGTLDLTLNDKDRYIPTNSRWLIAFIGGDVSMPVVVCRLPDE